ncbi:MAG: 4Fe-4S dicluster domain-containing protein [Bacteroidetes bacterium]|nr:4Fe-4S dicluster domain-containing protein [Bacteroidota bacterium]
MPTLFEQLQEDVRFVEGFNSCMNCGVCTAICPAAEFYNYDPRIIVDIIQSRDEEKIESLLCGETIWYCGQCMSCKTRCPRGNVPGSIIMSLRYLSQKLGCFTDSEKGRQQFAVKRTVGDNILKYGYCIYPDAVIPELHPEQGPVWEWIHQHAPDVYERFGASYKKDGGGVLRNTSEESLNELKQIFIQTGGQYLFDCIEKYSVQKAKEMNIPIGEGIKNDYFYHTYTFNSGKHYRDEQS